QTFDLRHDSCLLTFAVHRRSAIAGRLAALITLLCHGRAPSSFSGTSTSSCVLQGLADRDRFPRHRDLNQRNATMALGLADRVSDVAVVIDPDAQAAEGLDVADEIG